MATKLEQLQGLSQEDLIARLMKAEGQAGRKAGKLTLKVGAKGGVSIYGMGRFPMTAYASQWERIGKELFGVDPQADGCPLYTFITDNAGVIARKDMVEGEVAE